MLGRLTPWKGQEVFLRAFAEAFPESGPTASLVGAALFGEHDYEQHLRELVVQLGIAERVSFRGFRSDVFEELADADVLVHASIIAEPFGQVVIEGMAAGLPVIATRGGGPEEVIVHGETGLLVPPADVEALAEALRNLAGDPKLRRDLGERGRIAADDYRTDRAAAQMRAVYQQLLSGGSGRSIMLHRMWRRTVARAKHAWHSSSGRAVGHS
jgi:glycosyltransferase involved in cell wall biosynthesis